MVRRTFLLGFAAALAALPIHAAPQRASSTTPLRIVSTAPSITELLYALGLGDRVVGVTNYCHYPPEAKLKPKIGDYTSPNLEAIAALKPDLVILQTNPVRLAEHLQALKLKTLEINQDDVPAMYNSFKQVGAATGADAAAAKLIESVRARLGQIQKQASSLPRTRVMFVIGRTPNRLDGLVVVGRASYLNEVMETAGGENVFRDAPAPYPSVSLEEVLARNPQVIVDLGDHADPETVTAADQLHIVELWGRAPTLAAVKQHHVFAVTSDIFVVPGPRIVNAAEAFLGMLHPGLPRTGSK